MKLYRKIARLFLDYRTQKAFGNDAWKEKRDTINDLVREYFPSGSGFDNGTTFDFAASMPNKLVFRTSFHHMNQDGFYTNWTKHDIVLSPDFVYKYEIKITGRNQNEIKDYIHDSFWFVLDKEVADTA